MSRGGQLPPLTGLRSCCASSRCRGGTWRPILGNGLLGREACRSTETLLGLSTFSATWKQRAARSVPVSVRRAEKPMPDKADKRRGAVTAAAIIIAIAVVIFAGYNLWYLSEDVNDDRPTATQQQ